MSLFVAASLIVLVLVGLDRYRAHQERDFDWAAHRSARLRQLERRAAGRRQERG